MPEGSRCNWLFKSTREALGAGASVREIVLQPEPLLHQLEHVSTLHLRMLLRDGLLDLGQQALPADPAHTGLASLRGPVDQVLRLNCGSHSDTVKFHFRRSLGLGAPCAW